MAFVSFVVFPFDLLFLIYCMFEKKIMEKISKAPNEQCHQSTQYFKMK
jgi:hypothetical protein